MCLIQLHKKEFKAIPRNFTFYAMNRNLQNANILIAREAFSAYFELAEHRHLASLSAASRDTRSST